MPLINERLPYKSLHRKIKAYTEPNTNLSSITDSASCPTTKTEKANTTRSTQPSIGRGNTRDNDTAAAPAIQAPTATPQASNPQTNQSIKYRIINTHCEINLFGPTPPKNRRRTPQEMADELMIASIFKRPPTDYILDRPTYPYVPVPPKGKYCVNFDLNYQ